MDEVLAVRQREVAADGAGGGGAAVVRALNGGAPLVLYLFTMRPTPLSFAPDFRERVSV